ncbi:MAG TPA: hypothetical protein VIP11_25300 [Gemmatimonadaceae bacterium]
MTFRFTAKTLFGATAMLTLGAALATGQDTSRTRMPRSDRRLPISKEAPGEVVPPRVDTVTIYRSDTVTMTRRVVDTVRVTRTRIDTVIPRLAAYKYPKGFFAGAAGGFSSPDGSIYIPNSTGGTAQIQLGWLNAKQALGARFDWNGAWLGPDSRFSRFQGRASLQNFSIDGKLQWPFNFGGDKYTTKDYDEPARTYSRGPILRFGIYGIGGFTYTTYKNLPVRVDNVDINNLDNLTFINGDSVVVVTPANRDLFINNGVFVNGNNVAFFVPGDDSWHSRGGWNAGGGLSMFYKHTELFVEARVMGFKPRHDINGVNIHASQARQVPVVLGLNWY